MRHGHRVAVRPVGFDPRAPPGLNRRRRRCRRRLRHAARTRRLSSRSPGAASSAAESGVRRSDLVPGPVNEEAAARTEEEVALTRKFPIGHGGIRKRHHEVGVLPTDGERVGRLIPFRIDEVHILRRPGCDQRPGMLRV